MNWTAHFPADLGYVPPASTVFKPNANRRTLPCVAEVQGGRWEAGWDKARPERGSHINALAIISYTMLLGGPSLFY